MSRLAVYMEISRERDRQDWLRSQGKFRATLADTEPGWGATGPDATYGHVLTLAEKHAVLSRKVGDVARQCLAIGNLTRDVADLDTLRVELVQVAALAVAWIESLPDPDDTRVPVAR